MLVTRYYASLIRRWSPRDPIVRMCVPLREEVEGPSLPEDPFGELVHTPQPRLVRRYRDRAALWVTTHCAVHCRHCTRRNELPCAPRDPLPKVLARAVEWLRRHPSVREVLVTGGDPLTLSDHRIEEILRSLRQVPSLGVLRVATRMPVLLPSRITRSLCQILRTYAPVWLVTHFNHPVELTPEAIAACGRLVDAGIPVVNQTVLLRGVNDSVPVLRRLFEGLLRARVKPYYLFCADPVQGTAHFRVRLERTLQLVTRLRRELSGLAMPLLAADVADAPAKVALPLVTVEPAGPDRVRFRDWLGDVWDYPLPWSDRPAVANANSHQRR